MDGAPRGVNAMGSVLQSEPTMAKRTEAEAGKLSAILWAGLGYLAKKREKRDLIPPGDTRVDVLIEGRVGRSKICEHVVGRLHLAAPTQSASSSAADAAHVVALLLAAVPEAAELQQSIAKFHAANKTLPSIDPAAIEAARAWLSLLRSHVPTTKAGALTFEVSKETR